MNSLSGVINYESSDGNESDESPLSVAVDVMPAKAAEKESLSQPLVIKENESAEKLVEEEPKESALDAKFQRFLKLKKQGIHLNETLLSKRSFRNPRFYQKLIQFYDLDEIGSNLSLETFDPSSFPVEAFVDSIEQEQQKIQTHQPTQIQFVQSNADTEKVNPYLAHHNKKKQKRR